MIRAFGKLLFLSIFTCGHLIGQATNVESHNGPVAASIQEASTEAYSHNATSPNVEHLAVQTNDADHLQVNDDRPLLGLVMIVKNEAKSMQKLADSLRDILDYWTILDTGSTDGTQEVIKKAFAGIPGQLFQEPFVDFATSRNRALELAGAKTVFLLSLDGDMSLQNPGELRKFCEQHKDEQHGAYRISLYDEAASLSWWNSWLMRAGKGVHWVGRVHEYVSASVSSKNVHGARIIYHKDREYLKSRERHKRDLELLLDDYQENTGNYRAVFYLGQTCECLGKIEQAYDWYTKRSQMGGWYEEIYESLYRRARIAQRVGRPLKDVLDLYLQAYKVSPHRVEPLYAIAKMYKDEADRAKDYRLFPLAYIFALRASTLQLPKQDRLFVRSSEYVYKRWDLLAILAWHAKEYDVGEAAARKVHEQYPHDGRLKQNLQFYLDRK